jgi:hypothetical protein
MFANELFALFDRDVRANPRSCFSMPLARLTQSIPTPSTSAT